MKNTESLKEFKKLNSYEKDYLLKYNILVYSKISPYLNKKAKF